MTTPKQEMIEKVLKKVTYNGRYIKKEIVWMPQLKKALSLMHDEAKEAGRQERLSKVIRGIESLERCFDGKDKNWKIKREYWKVGISDTLAFLRRRRNYER